MQKIFGKPIADKINSSLKIEIDGSGVMPGLAVVLVGGDKASHVYVSLKEKSAEEVGIHFEKFLFDKDIDEREIILAIESLNERKDIHGVIVQLPLPKKFDTDKIISTIDPKKDADGFHRETLKKFLAGGKELCPVFPRAIVEMVISTGENLKGRSAVILVNSDLFGNILSRALEDIGLKVEVVRVGAGEAFVEQLKTADVIVSVCGVPKLIISEMVRDGAVIIDGGISVIDGKVVGDVDQSSFESRDIFLSPVPKGVGPVTVACLLRRVVELALNG